MTLVPGCLICQKHPYLVKRDNSRWMQSSDCLYRNPQDHDNVYHSSVRPDEKNEAATRRSAVHLCCIGPSVIAKDVDEKRRQNEMPLVHACNYRVYVVSY